MKEIRKHIRSVTLQETDKGWVWLEYDSTYCSLSRAVDAVYKDSVSLTSSKDMVVTEITYLPCTQRGTDEVASVLKA